MTLSFFSVLVSFIIIPIISILSASPSFSIHTCCIIASTILAHTPWMLIIRKSAKIESIAIMVVFIPFKLTIVVPVDMFFLF
jgi:hypothetical protein